MKTLVNLKISHCYFYWSCIALILILSYSSPSFALPPANDNFADAIELTGASGDVVGTTNEATSEASEPAQNGAINSIWYKWTAPSDGNFVFTTGGSDFNTFLSIFTGNTLASLTIVGQNNNILDQLQSAVAFAATSGEVFYIAVDGDSSITGNVIMNYAPASDLLFKDINPGVADSIPVNFTKVNNTVFFSANDGSTGTEPWKTDGTPSGTQLVKDITPGNSFSISNRYTDVNGTLFFGHLGPGVSFELYKSDGTEAGTTLVKDINPGGGGSFLDRLTNVNGTLFFSANDNSGIGEELWKSDGTEAGTILVKDINPGPANPSFFEFISFNNKLFFRASDGASGNELWTSDGTEVGTVMIKDINPGPNNSFPQQFTKVLDTLFFTANDGVNGNELWKTDGTTDGTVLVKNIRPGSTGNSPALLTNVNGTLFFRADDGTNGAELWKSDGTEAGTVLVKDIRNGFLSSSPNRLTNSNGTLFFGADDSTHGFELWKSDGTEAGTVLVKDINPGGSGSSIEVLVNVNGTLFFGANDGQHGRELWQSDGTEAGTVMVDDSLPGSLGSFTSGRAFSGEFIFEANGGFGRELYKTLDVVFNFTDVPPGSFGFDFTETFLGTGITGGCGGGNYCPNDPVTRVQMAVFIEKASRGANFVLPPATGLFADVPISNPFAPWVEQFANDGITGGCGDGNYCPDDPVTRGQMAVFIEKALRGAAFVPPPAIGLFNDVPISDPFAPWVEQFANDGITGGCGGGDYCPNNQVTRAQMAIFMVKAFDFGS